jgi:hypothetical protein
MKPGIGKAVHYVSHGTPVRSDGTQAFASRCRAADITEVDQADVVGLIVKNPTGLFFHSLADGGVSHDEDEKAGGTWHWPEKD